MFRRKDTPRQRRREPRCVSYDPGDRTAVNIAAVILILVLVVGGLWVARALYDNVKLQNCIASGRRDCAVIEPPQ